ncbi:hypothetical protein [Chryseobacterium hagamense]|nr:hypothetical protein [Chryseobacterium hagamense]
MRSLLFFFMFAIRAATAYAQEIQIISINEPQGYLLLKYKNTTNQKILIYENSLYTKFELWNSERPIGYDTFVGKTYDAYNINNDINQQLIENTMKKYNIDSKQAFYFLKYIECKIMISPKSTKILKLKAFGLPTKPLKPMEKTEYYIQGTVFFNNNFYPNQFVESLSKNNSNILDKIEIPKTKIDINTFFSKELSKLPKGFIYDEKTGKVIEENK